MTVGWAKFKPKLKPIDKNLAMQGERVLLEDLENEGYIPPTRQLGRFYPYWLNWLSVLAGGAS